ncbi:hypothetical protein BDB00DRAFT_461143 [Zychaea mexicana]|uniref:uncharacterized protein n=1 Tax=Zychaea mexicana TaxID=64656 RepID=UPI0022FF157D|nr:uncharacterized protein BDB00DRAFT_461143 [Zychaea mexicana]KAI9492092.1 hypothetical protein BDB00DRAFT_461143 [Zychaea mexicana]
MKPSSSNDESWVSSFDFARPPAFLRLRIDIMERICRFLPTQRDLFEITVANRTWSTASTPILWEAPVLRDPTTFQLFLGSATSRKRLALYVKRLSLCVRDGECPTIFRAMLDSVLTRHNQKNIPLRWPELIMHLVRQCENIEALKIYGWQLDPMKIESIGATLSQLTSLTVIGSNETFKRPFVLRNMMSRLRELRLDGEFYLSVEFAGTLASRAHALRSLEIPLCHGKNKNEMMEEQTLARLCSGELDLTELTLTEGRPMADVHVERVVSAFPNLRSLTLHGTTFVSAGIISTVIANCQNIENIELRADPQTISSQKNKSPTYKGTNSWSTAIHLKRLLLENMIVPEKVMEDLAQSCGSLKTIGLRNCEDITDDALIQLLECNDDLRTLHIIECTSIGDATLEGLARSAAQHSIQDIYMEACGPVSPRAIYLLCCATADHRLRRICFDGYNNLASSIVGSLAIERLDEAQNAAWGAVRLTLDERAIDALASADSQMNAELMEVPSNRYLTGEQLVMLANELHVSVTFLNDAIEKVQAEGPVDDSSNEQEPEQASKHEDYEQKTAHKSLSRVASLKSQYNLRPTTPALWAHANESEIQQYLPTSSSKIHNDNATVTSATSRSSRLSQRNSTTASTPVPDAEPVMEHEEEQDFEEPTTYENTHASTTTSYRLDQSPTPNYPAMQFVEPFTEEAEETPVAMPPPLPTAAPEPPLREEWPILTTTSNDAVSNNSNNNSKASKTVELGGWGSLNPTPWSKKVASTSKQPGPASQRQAEQPWTPYTAEHHEHRWQQETLEQQAPSFKRGGTGRGARSSFVMESDGWGTPENNIPWNDLRQQGYAHELLEKQKKTQFWDPVSQQYKTSGSAAPVARPTAAPSEPTPPALASTAWPPLEKASASPKKVPENKTKYSRQRSPEFLSSDEEDIDWDDDDGVTIKTSPALEPQHGRQQQQQQQQQAQPQARAHSKSLPDNTCSPKAPEKAAPRNKEDDSAAVAQWHDFASIGVAEQIARQEKTARHNTLTAAASFDAQSGFLIDTSDVVAGGKLNTKLTKDNNIAATTARNSSFESSSLWEEMSGLTMDNNNASPPISLEEKSDSIQDNALIDTNDDDLLSPEGDQSNATIQQPLIPDANLIQPLITHMSVNDPLESLIMDEGDPVQRNETPLSNVNLLEGNGSPLSNVGSAQGNGTPISSDDHMQGDDEASVSNVDSTQQVDDSLPGKKAPQRKRVPIMEHPKMKRIHKMELDVPDKGKRILEYRLIDTPEQIAQAFCKEHEVPENLHARVFEILNEVLGRKKTKCLLDEKDKQEKKKKKKSTKKKSSSTITEQATPPSS